MFFLFGRQKNKGWPCRRKITGSVANKPAYFPPGCLAGKDLFTEEEKIVLAITDEVTLIHRHGLSEKTYGKALALFDKNYISQLIMAVVTINAWNRIAISTQLEVGN